MKRTGMVYAGLVLLLAACVPAAQPTAAPAAAPAPVVSMYLAALSGANEVPANPSAATGSAMLMLNETAKTLTVSGAYSGVTATAAHIHGPAAKTANAGVLIPLTAAGGSISGNATVTDAQIADLKAGLWYVNLHSAAFPGGEIRGQLEKQ